MRVTIRPAGLPNCDLDVTHALIAAVAHQLWEHCGGTETSNWLEAERFVARLAAGQAEAHRARARARRAESQTRRKPRAEPERITGPLPAI